MAVLVLISRDAHQNGPAAKPRCKITHGAIRTQVTHVRTPEGQTAWGGIFLFTFLLLAVPTANQKEHIAKSEKQSPKLTQKAFD